MAVEPWRYIGNRGWLWGLDLLNEDHRPWRGPGDWVDILGASVITGVAPKTITGWLAKGGPARHPFPPAYRFLYRLYWPMMVVHKRAAQYPRLPR